jgi:hypothetical protein
MRYLGGGYDFACWNAHRLKGAVRNFAIVAKSSKAGNRLSGRGLVQWEELLLAAKLDRSGEKRRWSRRKKRGWFPRSRGAVAMPADAVGYFANVLRPLRWTRDQYAWMRTPSAESRAWLAS